MNHTLGAPLAQINEKGQEQEVYYLNHTMIGAKPSYNPIEMECLALAFAIRKILPSGTSNPCHIQDKSFKNINDLTSSLNSRLINWALLFCSMIRNSSLKKKSRDRPLQTFWLVNQCPKTLSYMKPYPMKQLKATNFER